MATINHHVYFIQNLLNKGPVSDDTRFSNRLIAHALKQARSRLVKIKLDKADYINDSNYQRICIPLELHTYHDCNCITDNTECLILRSTTKIPDYMVAKWGATLEITNLNGHKLSQTSITSNEYSQYSITNNPARIGYFIDDSYLFILNNIKLVKVIGKAIWEDPEDVDDFNASTCEEEDCTEYYSEDFPIDAELVYPMYQLTLQLLGATANIPEDNRNDGRSVENIQAIDPNENTRRV